MQRTSLIPILLAAAVTSCGGGGATGLPPLTTIPISCTVNASAPGPALAPLWRDHYDLSFEHLDYSSEPGLLPLVQSLKPRSWRCSVGRWEISIPPPPGGDSTDPAVLKTVDREYYRGPNTLLDADDPANYDFTYLDAQLAGIAQTGAEPYVCFDMMPFTLSSETDPQNAFNFGLGDPALSYSNGIRTAPPAAPAVYARVVRNTVRHMRGLFAGTTDFGITWIEIGNEPDLLDAAAAPLPYFWTGTPAEWIAMYAAIAAEIDSDASIKDLIQLGGGSFAFQPHEPAPLFLGDFLADVSMNGRRLDFLSYHSYGDTPAEHLIALVRLDAIFTTIGMHPTLVNAEWGRALDGLDPAYNQLEHGLFRTKVMILMQLFGVELAHEALLRDPLPMDDSLGLIRTGPAASKPVSDVYEALSKLNETLLALPIVATPDTYFIATTNAAGTRVFVVHAGDDPAPGVRTRLELGVTSLPWGGASFHATRFVVSDATAGVTIDASWSGLGGGSFEDTALFGPGPGEGRFFVWELVKD